MNAESRPRRIGIFGGTFDPPHVGHIKIAERAIHQLHLDRLYFVPAYLPPHKRNGTSGSPRQRLTMVQQATRNNPRFRVASFEINRKGVSYTIDTLHYFRRRHRNAKLFLIVGGDNFRQFRTWKSSLEIMEFARLVVYNRHGVSDRGTKTPPTTPVYLRGIFLDVSSTLVRRRVQHGESIHTLVPLGVEQYIRKKKLYL